MASTERTTAPGPARARAQPLTGPFGRPGLRIGSVAGIDIGLDASWIVIFLIVTLALSQDLASEHEDWSRALVWTGGVAASLLFFLSILLHELGHSLTSNRLGLRVTSITLFVFGGLARLSDEPSRPGQELLIAVAGPAVSVLLGVLFLGASFLIPEAGDMAGMLVAILTWLGTINLFLAAFNCVPGFPLDGGRVLRAIVWQVSGSQRKATYVASAVGSAFAWFLIGTGVLLGFAAGQLFQGLWLVLIGWFLMNAAKGSVQTVVLKEGLSRIPVADAMEGEVPTVDAGTSVAELIEGPVLRQGLRWFLVQEDGKPAGIVTLKELRGVPADERATTRVDAAMVPAGDLVSIAPDASLWDALKQMDETAFNQLPVIADGRQVGVLTREHLLRLMRNLMELER